jgi:cholesterol transport system auxiliary component
LLLKTSENQIDYYADIEWGERLSGLTQVMILYSLQNAGCFRAILRNPDGVYPDYNLKIEIRQFYVDRTLKPCRAVVEYFLQLVKSDDRQVVATETIMEQTPLETESSKEVIEKLDKTNQKAIEKLIHWISNSLK